MTKHYTDLELMNWRPAKNVGGSTIGSREVCQVVTGGDGLSRSIVAVQQPSSTAGKSYCVNGPMPIPAGKFGRVCFGPVVLVAYDTGSPAVDDQFGWKASQGTVSTGSNPLFSVMRVVDSTNKLLLGVVTGGTSLIPIELKGDLSGTSSTTAYRLIDDGSGNEEADLTGDTIDVYNQPQGRQFRALGRDTMGSGTGGARGWVQMSSITGRYEVVQVQEQAKVIGGAATVDGSKNLVSISTLYSMDGGQLPAATTLSVSTTPALYVTGWTTNSGSDGTFLWDEHNARYKPIDLVCKT